MNAESGSRRRGGRLLPAGRRSNERGIALVSVLLGLALLGVIATSFLRDTRTATTIARNLVQNAKAEALADAGVERAMLGLLDADRKTAWRADGRAYELRLGEGTVRIRLQDEAGKVDVNRAPERLLRRLFLAVGLAEDAASTLVDGIMAFRRQRSAERSEGSGSADRSETPAFESLDELMRLPGMQEDMRERLAPYLTVYSGRERVDPAVAPPLLLQILPALTAFEGEAQPADREPDASAPQGEAVTVTVLAEAVIPEGGQFIREAVLRRTDDTAKPFRILLWRQLWRPPAGAP
jgi:general secretion pathway protein K